jgi:hypothetical protein
MREDLSFIAVLVTSAGSGWEPASRELHDGVFYFFG